MERRLLTRLARSLLAKLTSLLMPCSLKVMSPLFREWLPVASWSRPFTSVLLPRLSSVAPEANWLAPSLMLSAPVESSVRPAANWLAPSERA